MAQHLSYFGSFVHNSIRRRALFLRALLYLDHNASVSCKTRCSSAKRWRRWRTRSRCRYIQHVDSTPRRYLNWIVRQCQCGGWSIVFLMSGQEKKFTQCWWMFVLLNALSESTTYNACCNLPTTKAYQSSAFVGLSDLVWLAQIDSKLDFSTLGWCVFLAVVHDNIRPRLPVGTVFSSVGHFPPWRLADHVPSCSGSDAHLSRCVEWDWTRPTSMRSFVIDWLIDWLIVGLGLLVSRSLC